MKEKNYLNVYIYDKWNGHHVPDFQEGEEFQPTTREIRQGITSKPNYLTEADLVTLMDKNGIGKPLGSHGSLCLINKYIRYGRDDRTTYPNYHRSRLCNRTNGGID